MSELELKLSTDEALVLFGFLSRFSNEETLSISHDSEEQVLNNLLCLLESQLSEPLSPDYKNLLNQAREKLVHVE